MCVCTSILPITVAIILLLLQEHTDSCKFTRHPCPNSVYGCTKLLLQNQVQEHLEKECRFAPVMCPWCSKKVQNKDVSLHYSRVEICHLNFKSSRRSRSTWWFKLHMTSFSVSISTSSNSLCITIFLPIIASHQTRVQSCDCCLSQWLWWKTT